MNLLIIGLATFSKVTLVLLDKEGEFKESEVTAQHGRVIKCINIAIEYTLSRYLTYAPKYRVQV